MSGLQIGFIIATFLAPLLVWVFGRKRADDPVIRLLERALALSLVGFYLGDLGMRFTDGTFTPGHALPMQLCDWALMAIVVALWARRRLFFEVAYFWGLAGTFQALFTPAIAPDIAWIRKFGFFYIHAGIVVGIFHLLLTVRWRPTPRSIAHVIVASEIYLALALLTNHLTAGNYGFLSHQPPTASMLDLFSTTQWLYVVEINLVAFVFFAVLYLPWWIADMIRSRRPAELVET